VCLLWASIAQASLVGEPLRILTVGDSITEGAQSFATTGYNKVLNDLLADSGVSYSFLGSRYRRTSGAAGRGRIINGQEIDDDTGSVDPLFQPWMQHYGIGGSSADNPDIFSDPSDFRTETYSNTRSLVDRFVDRDDPFNVNSIRDPNNPSVLSTANGNFQTTVWGEQSGGAPVAPPNVILLHIGTNTVSSNSAAASAQQLNTLLRVFDILRTTPVAGGGGETYLPSNVHIALSQMIPKILASSSEGGGFSEQSLDRSFDYNGLIGDKNSSVYDSVSTTFKDQIIAVNHFAITANTVLTDAVRAAAVAFDGSLTTDTAILNVIDPDLDGLVDWTLTTNGIDPYNELTGDPALIGDANMASNTNLFADMIHPTSLGYAIMAEVWHQQLFAAVVTPEPGTTLLLVGGMLVIGLRRSRCTLNH